MKKNNYKYRSGNIRNINKLLPATGNFKYAQALDQFTFYSVNSSFILPRDEKAEGWFRIGYEAIANYLGYRSARSITTLIKKFIKLGLIEKIRPLIGGTNKACLRITAKTKALLNLSTSCEQPEETIAEASETELTPIVERKKFDQNFTCGSENISLAYKEKRVKEKDINIITPLQGCGKQGQRYNVPNQVEMIFKKIGERLPETQKTAIWAAVCNLQKQHAKQISNVAEFTAWIAFSILNASHQLKSSKGFEHQLNILMKIARSGQGLQKPRGFHNHWDVGQELKQKEEQILHLHEKIKRHASASSADDYQKASSPFNAPTQKEVWKGKGGLSSLKSQRAEILSQINGLISDTKSIEMLFASNPDELERQKQINQNKMAEFKRSLAFKDAQIKALEQSEEQAIETQWQPLYAMR